MMHYIQLQSDKSGTFQLVRRIGQLELMVKIGSNGNASGRDVKIFLWFDQNDRLSK